MKSIFSILCCLLYGIPAFTQTVKLDWVNALPGNSFDVCKAIVLDDDANVYATGYFSTTVDFDAGPGIFNLTSVSTEDAFLSKYDSSGKLIWAKGIGDFRYQAGFAITLDKDRNIYVAGIYFGTTDFDPGPGVFNLTSAGNEDIFVCKFDNDGNFIWAKSFGGPNNEFCNSIKLDGQGNIYINGYFENTADFDPGPGTFNLTSAGSTDIFVCKLDNTGSLMWAKRIGGPMADVAYSLGLDEQNNVYSTGFFWSTVDFDPGPGNFDMTSAALGDGYVLKLSANGAFMQAGKIGGNSRVRCTALKTDLAGHIFITGHFDGEADFDMGAGTQLLTSPVIDDDDIFIVKYDLNLNLVWVKQVGGPSFQKAVDIETDDAGSVYITGHYNGTADFDPGIASHDLTAAGDPELFVLKLTGNGNFVWVANSTGPFYGSGYTLKLDKSKHIYVGGTFEGTKDFDPGPDEEKRTSAGQSEIFIQKLKQCATPAVAQTLNVNSCTAYKLGNKTYNASGTYTHFVLNTQGCDSIIITLNLHINRIMQTVNIAICQGEMYMAAGNPQTQTGLYYDTLKTAAGCDSVVVTSLTVREKPRPVLGADRNICAGQDIILNPGQFQSYLWQDMSTEPQYRATVPGIYTVTVTNQFNCKAAARLIIRNIVPVPARFLPADTELCNGNVLRVSVPGYKSYAWSTGANSRGIDIRSGGNYYLTVTSFDNCVGTDSIHIQPIDCLPVGIPNAFSPNSDGRNDLFRPTINIEISDYQLRVFNRVGQLIYQSKDQGQGWDGRFKGQQQSPGNYIYQLSFRNTAGKLFSYKGNLLLLR